MLTLWAWCSQHAPADVIELYEVIEEGEEPKCAEAKCDQPSYWLRVEGQTNSDDL